MGALSVAIIMLNCYTWYKFGEFLPVTPEFARLNCVQQVLISTQVSSFTFAKGQHSCSAATCQGVTLRCQVGYMLGFAMHFYFRLTNIGSLFGFVRSGNSPQRHAVNYVLRSFSYHKSVIYVYAIVLFGRSFSLSLRHRVFFYAYYCSVVA